MPRSERTPQPLAEIAFEPFSTVEEAWFWCVQCRSAQEQGARVAAGLGRQPRPCEPLDILTVVERLYRRGRLVSAHLQVLTEYGRQLMRPDPDRPRERKAAKLWDEAVQALAPQLQDKGIVA